MDLNLKEKVLLITGAGKGFGLTIAKAFAREGCHVGLCDIDEDVLKKGAEEIRLMGVNVTAVQADMCKPEEAENFINKVAEELGGIDILVNHVGTTYGMKFLMESTDDEWRNTFETNVIQTLRTIRLTVPHMRKRGGGCIIITGSISGCHSNMAGIAQYGSSKATLIFLTEHLALELVHDNIRVNTVSPGSLIWPGGGWSWILEKNKEDFETYIREGFPMGRLGHPKDIADVYVFLASEPAHWINGRNIRVDGLQQAVPHKWIKPW